MGKPAQKRLVRKLDLERFLSQIEPHPSPRASLEQYTISEVIAASMLYLAAYVNDDVVGKNVLDLGCGTGRLALGAAFLGARSVVGIDIDKVAIRSAWTTSKKFGFRGVQWIVGDISAVTGTFNTVLQNPPFGVQKRAADRKFLEKALEVGAKVYSLHNHPSTDKQLVKQLRADKGCLLQVAPSPFLERFVEKHGGSVEAVYALLMTIPRMFDFHMKAKHDFVVDLYILKRHS
ncbi:methyltransferase domain-containing protein [Candidatus Bathyarchaeota archaeon A05DMB-2]|jgi:putative methylase|nr:methyltransferase domain-containing protein [Candidatus Bathyarchaeota archaeon A05DMB-2]